MAKPEDIVDMAIERNLDGICITEHESLYASAPFDKLQNRHGLVIFRGVEVGTDIGHMLVYGVSQDEWQDWGKNEISDHRELIKVATALGGVVIPAHPCILMPEHPYDLYPEIVIEDGIRNIKGVPALEVCNGKQLKYPMVCSVLGDLAKSMGLAATGGSDAHIPENVGIAYTVFKAPIFTLKGLSAALLSGQYHPEIL